MPVGMQEMTAPPELMLAQMMYAGVDHCVLQAGGAYGAMTGLFYRSFKWNLYVSLLAAMLVGRVVSGIANAVLFGITGAPYGFEAFLTASFVTALPGIAIQIVFIPVLVIAIEKLKLVEPIVRQTKGSSHSKED